MGVGYSTPAPAPSPKTVACSKCKTAVNVEGNLRDTAVYCEKCAENVRKQRDVTVLCKFCKVTHKIPVTDDANLERLLQRSKDIDIYCKDCADATREVLKNADYHQLKFNSPDGKEGYIVYPKDFDDLIRERIKGGEIKLAVTGTS